MANGSVAEVTALLASWCERASEGMAVVEYDSELARQRVVDDLRSRLRATEIPFREVTVPETGSPFELVNKLIAELGALPAGVVSISGFEKVFPLTSSNEETLAVFNSQRERLAEPPLRQIWWLSPRVWNGLLREAPDLYSWFIVRLHLTETVLYPSALSGTIEPRTFLDLDGTAQVPLEDARQRAAELARRFERALEDPARPIGELVRQLMEPAVRALREAGAEREARELERDLHRCARAKGRPVVRVPESAERAPTATNMLFKSQGHLVPAQAQSLNDMGVYLQTQGDLVGARLYLERALAICEKALGAEHPNTARSLNNLGALLQSQGDLAEARRYYDRALAVFENVLGTEHPDTSTSLNNLGGLLKIQGDLEGARSYFERALAILDSRLGPDHPDAKLVRKNLKSLDDR